jgi:hypothetical protein
VTQMDGQPNQISTNAAVALASTAIFGKQIWVHLLLSNKLLQFLFQKIRTLNQE